MGSGFDHRILRSASRLEEEAALMMWKLEPRSSSASSRMTSSVSAVSTWHQNAPEKKKKKAAQGKGNVCFQSFQLVLLFPEHQQHRSTQIHRFFNIIQYIFFFFILAHVSEKLIRNQEFVLVNIHP